MRLRRREAPQLSETMSSQSSSSSTRSPWLSINDMLIQNKCFLCEEVFPKGKVKKVFQVMHLLDYFKNRLEQENAGPVPPLQSRHLRNCYNRFVEISRSSTPEEFMDKLSKELTAHDAEVWMSGLTCDLQPLCQQELRFFVNTPMPVGIADAIEPKMVIDASKMNVDQEDNNKKPKMDIMKMMTFANKKECPPGCDCDNPWPFIS